MLSVKRIPIFCGRRQIALFETAAAIFTINFAKSLYSGYFMAGGFGKEFLLTAVVMIIGVSFKEFCTIYNEKPPVATKHPLSDIKCH